MRSQLDDLIVNLENGVSKNEPFVRDIAYPDLLIDSLKELRDLIGNDSIKDSIASQVSYLITLKDSNSTDVSEPMLNTILYGPPGTGKTTIGVKLAKIWKALGYIKSHQSRDSGESVKDYLNRGNLETAVVWFSVIFLLYTIFSPLICGIYNCVGQKYFIIGVGIILLFIVILLSYLYYNSRVLNSVKSKKINNPAEIFSFFDDSQLIKVVSREDFVDKYVGWTDKKTKALLKECIGKVLFIDEAYSLLSGPNDMYGKEALNTINRFLSENPGKIIIIMAGYRKLLHKLFETQPGLARRFMWHFECNGYSGEELFEIFLNRLEKEKWKVKKEDLGKLKEYFMENPHDLPSYGGDCERLSFFSQLEYSKDNTSGKKLNKFELNYDQVRRGFDTLRSNKVKKDDSIIPVDDLLENIDFSRFKL